MNEKVSVFLLSYFIPYLRRKKKVPDGTSVLIMVHSHIHLLYNGGRIVHRNKNVYKCGAADNLRVAHRAPW